MNKRILIIGAFGYRNNKLDGQTIKTRDILRLFQERHKGKTDYFDTLLVKQTKNPLLLLLLFFKLLIADIVIVAPASHAMEKMFPTIYHLSKVLRYEIIVTCVGGWQVEFFRGGHGYMPHPKIMNYCKKIKGFLPELANVESYLKNNEGFKNTMVFPNFRFVPDFISSGNNTETFKIVFMARINKRKGIETVFNFAEKAKEKGLKIQIDFYGQIEKEDKNLFIELVNRNSSIIRYLGPLLPQDIYSTLSKYDVLVLPTQYYTEGFPGSILDAYISGIPVIVTEWKHAHEFVSDGKSGIIIPFGSCQKEFDGSLYHLYSDKKLLNEMKLGALNEAKKYTPDVAWNVLMSYL